MQNFIINLGVDKVIELQKIMPKAAYFNYVNVLELSYDTEGTLTSDENEENLCPEPLTSLFDYEAINLDSATLKDICNLKYEEYKSTYTSKSFNFLSENTKLQSLSSAWNIHRAGRITASNFYEVMHFKYKNSNLTYPSCFGQLLGCLQDICGFGQSGLLSKKFVLILLSFHSNAKLV
nr:uncharacterized protein LOC124815290 [Hydra vulgaris]